MNELIDGENSNKVTELLEGRRIVAVDERNESMTLDDGTELKIIPNTGGCSCGSGDYWLRGLATCDNIITRASLGYSEDNYDEVISLYVYAEGMAPTEVVTVSGGEGNGCYGRGFEIEVGKP